METSLTLLKLGGSLLTDKTREKASRPQVIARLAREIAAALNTRDSELGTQHSGLSTPHSALSTSSPALILGHGSGSFGHATAKRHDTRHGVRDAAGWRGFADVSVAAQQLNRIVADALTDAGVPVFSVAPSASARCEDGVLMHLDLAPLRAALANGLVPLVMGDVAFDSVRGGTIVSTEEVFAYIAKHLPVSRMLLAGETEGVYASMADPRVLPEITPDNWAQISGGIGGSRGADVTGGMASKVRDMLALAQAHPGLSVHIFSGLTPGAVERALKGEEIGTCVTAHIR